MGVLVRSIANLYTGRYDHRVPPASTGSSPARLLTLVRLRFACRLCCREHERDRRQHPHSAGDRSERRPDDQHLNILTMYGPMIPGSGMAEIRGLRVCLGGGFRPSDEEDCVRQRRLRSGRRSPTSARTARAAQGPRPSGRSEHARTPMGKASGKSISAGMQAPGSRDSAAGACTSADRILAKGKG